jgi:hypothetical protein
MDNPKSIQLLINLAGVLVGLLLVGYIGWSALQTQVEASCGSQYPAATRFSLQTNQGKPLSAIQLQARAGVRDLGVIDNASVVQVAGGPSPDALDVKLRKLPGNADAGDKARNGIEFRWAPPGMAKATSACLSYSVFLSDKFDFGEGGVLPGVFAGAAPTGATGVAGASVSPAWDQHGQPLLTASLESGDIQRVTSNTKAVWRVNGWTKVEQEVVLNDAGQANGRARLWIDGTLVADDQRVQLRSGATTFLTGILAAASYRRVPDIPGSVQISPFEIAWR